MAVINFLPYQEKWRRDKSRFKIADWARQIGKSFTLGTGTVDDVIDAMALGQKSSWLILSRSERQAKELMDETIKPYARLYELAFKVTDHEFVVEADDAKGKPRIIYNALEIEFPNGAKITALPANPDTARGYSRNVLLDEFAFHPNSREIWKALFPVISAGFRIEIASTPNGRNNKFYELMTGKDSIWSRHKVDIYEAVRQGLDRDIDELRAGLADEDGWAQEYELQWLDEALAWLSLERIMSVEHEDAGIPELYQGGPCFIGNDIASRQDLWVAWVVERVGDVLWTREIKILKRVKFSVHDATMDELFKKYKVARLHMDQTGMGEKPVEDAIARYGSHRTEGVLFTGPSKLTLATLAKQRVEERTIRIPAGDTVLRADMGAVRKVVGPTGNARLVAERDSSGHADRYWAGALACDAASVGETSIEFHAVGRPRAGSQLGDYVSAA